MSGRVFVILYAIAVLGGVIFVGVRGEGTRDTADAVKQIVFNSPCKVDPKGAECQRILTSSIQAFDRHTSCVLARKVGVSCERKKGTSPQRKVAEATEGGSDAPEPPASRNGSAADPPAGPDNGGGGHLGDGGGSDPGEPPPAADPPGPPPGGGDPPPNPGPAPEPPSSPPATVGGIGVDVPLVPECDLAPALCSQR